MRNAVVWIVTGACLLWLPLPAAAQPSILFSTVRINSSLTPIGSGARAMGMGGAFIAVADDATAASWNPGGLMQLEKPECSFVVQVDYRRKQFRSSAHPEVSGRHAVRRQDLNYCSVAVPFRAFNTNMIFSLNYQRLYDFYDRISFEHDSVGVSPAGVFVSVKTRTEFRQSGALKALAPAWAVQITPRVSVGATFNIWTDNLGYDNGWQSVRDTRGSMSLHAPGNILNKSVVRQVYREENDNFEGFNMNLGFLWHMHRRVTLGGVLKTPFTAKVDRRTWMLSESRPAGPLPAAPGLIAVPVSVRETIRMRFPLSGGLGLALRLSDRLTLAGDAYRTTWSDFWIESGGRKTSPVTGECRRQSRIRDTTHIRLGCEYLWIAEKTIVPLRLGMFYDPEPARKRPDTGYGLSFGTGALIGRMQYDCAYVYRRVRRGKADTLAGTGARAEVEQHSVYVSAIAHF